MEDKVRNIYKIRIGNTFFRQIDWGMFVDEVGPPEVEEEVEDLESYGIVLEEENETNGFEIVR